MFKSLNKVVSQRGSFAQSLFTVFARIWLLTSVVLFMKKCLNLLTKWFLNVAFSHKVFSQCTNMASHSVVLFMKGMFKSLHKKVSQHDFFAQSLVTVFALSWLLTSMSLIMRKIG